MAGDPGNIIEELMTRTTAEGRGISAVLEDLPMVLREAMAIAAESEAAGATVEGLAAVTAAAEGLALVLVIPVILACVAAIYLWLYAVLLIAHAVERLTFLGIGPKIASFILMATGPAVAASSALSKWLGDSLTGMLHGFITATHWAVTQGVSHAEDPIKAIVDLEVEGLRETVNNLSAIVYGLLGSPYSIGGGSGGDTSGLSGQVATLKAQVVEIEARNSRQGQEISQLNQRMSTVEHTSQTLSAEVENLRVTIYGARASIVGVQDLVHSVDQLRQETMVQLDHQQAELTTHGQAIAQAAPLLSLLYLGERGLGNLRRLEDNPCQCPALPNFGALLPEALAVYEFVTNG